MLRSDLGATALKRMVQLALQVEKRSRASGSFEEQHLRLQASRSVRIGRERMEWGLLLRPRPRPYLEPVYSVPVYTYPCMPVSLRTLRASRVGRLYNTMSSMEWDRFPSFFLFFLDFVVTFSCHRSLCLLVCGCRHACLHLSRPADQGKGECGTT